MLGAYCVVALLVWPFASKDAHIYSHIVVRFIFFLWFSGTIEIDWMAQGFLYVGLVVANGFFFVCGVWLRLGKIILAKPSQILSIMKVFRTDRKQFDEAFKCQFRPSSVMLSGYERMMGWNCEQHFFVGISFYYVSRQELWIYDEYQIFSIYRKHCTK